ncbi:MAG: helix-turn-helix transcriptional regulator [Bacillota bacterium]
MGRVTINPRTVRYLREKRAWTQEQLAEIAKIGVRTVQRIEKGEAVSFASVKAVAEALGVDLEALRAKPRPTKEDQTLLPRVTSGNEILSIVVGAAFLDLSHDDLVSEDEVALVSGFCGLLGDCDVLDEVSPAERVRVGYELGRMIEELDRAGFWVFGRTVARDYVFTVGNETTRLTGRTAVVRIVRRDNPEIVRKATADLTLISPKSKR